MFEGRENLKNYLIVLVWLAILSYFITDGYTSNILNSIVILSLILTLAAIGVEYVDTYDKYYKLKKALTYLITILWIILLGHWAITYLISTFALNDAYRIFQGVLFVAGVIVLLFITLYSLIRSVDKEAY